MAARARVRTARAPAGRASRPIRTTTRVRSIRSIRRGAIPPTATSAPPTARSSTASATRTTSTWCASTRTAGGLHALLGLRGEHTTLSAARAAATTRANRPASPGSVARRGLRRRHRLLLDAQDGPPAWQCPRASAAIAVLRPRRPGRRRDVLRALFHLRPAGALPALGRLQRHPLTRLRQQRSRPDLWRRRPRLHRGGVLRRGMRGRHTLHRGPRRPPNFTCEGPDQSNLRCVYTPPLAGALISRGRRLARGGPCSSDTPRSRPPQPSRCLLGTANLESRRSSTSTCAIILQKRC